MPAAARAAAMQGSLQGFDSAARPKFDRAKGNSYAGEQSFLCMRLIVVSNRLPFSVTMAGGKPQFMRSSGGLTTGMWSYLQRARTERAERPEVLWFGWPGATVPSQEEESVRQYARQEFGAHPVFVPQQQMDCFYNGFCNETLWP